MPVIPIRNYNPPPADRQRGQPTRRYFWIIVGYYLVAAYVRSTNGRIESLSNVDFSPDPDRRPGGVQPLEVIPGSNPEQGGHARVLESETTVHSIQIIKIDFQQVETPFIIAVWIFCASLAKIGFHMAPKLSQIFPDSCLLIVVGVVIGSLLYHTNSVNVSPLTPKTFFHYLLPPIILDAGYFMPNRLFFDNLGTILLMAVIGTLWNTFTIGLSLWGIGQWIGFGIELPLLQTLLFSALISAVDPVAVLAVFEEIHVNEVLYIVVFGESLLNDAVTVVLYHMFDDYAKMGPEKVTLIEMFKGVALFPFVALGGTAMGVIWGFSTGFVTKFTNHVRVIEPIFIFVMAYLAYLCAEIFHFSGILAVTFCGITMKNYVEANISHKSHTTVKYSMKMLSSSAETIIFMFLGVATVYDDHEWNVGFTVATIVFCTIYRFIGTIGLSALANRFRIQKVGIVDQFVMSYGGLRGAVAFALVLLVEEDAVNDDKLRRMFISTTITVIYFTVFVQGITIKPLVEWLKVEKAEKRKPTMNERIHERLMDHTMAALESLVGRVGHYNFRDKFKHIDNQYIRPCLLRDYKGAEPKILETYFNLKMRDAMDMMNKNPVAIIGLGSNRLSPESLAVVLKNLNTSSNNLEGSSNDLAMAASNWNRDEDVLDRNLSRKNMSDANIDDLLTEKLYKPYRMNRRCSYSRHAVNEKDLTTDLNLQADFKSQINFKKIMSASRAQKRKKFRFPSILNESGSPTGSSRRVSFGEELSTAREGVMTGDEEEIMSPFSPSAVDPSVLSWNREDEDDSDGFSDPRSEIQPGEVLGTLPAWSINKEYLV